MKHHWVAHSSGGQIVQDQGIDLYWGPSYVITWWKAEGTSARKEPHSKNPFNNSTNLLMKAAPSWPELLPLGPILNIFTLRIMIVTCKFWGVLINCIVQWDVVIMTSYYFKSIKVAREMKKEQLYIYKAHIICLAGKSHLCHPEEPL
jgi:hypothetical protein